jgi:hypothetical protein
MGASAPATPDAPADATAASAAAKAAPRRTARRRDTSRKSARPSTRDTSSRPADEGAQSPVGGPYAGETKMQVNPRIYAGTWRYYEDLVDELPRPQRRGALTALVNAVLARHAPTDADAALEAIAWLRQAESRQEPS